MPRATLVLRQKVIDEGGNILELVVWQVMADVQRIRGDAEWPGR
jgi:hypothetical protein